MDPEKKKETIWVLKMDPTAGFGETDEEGVSLKLVEKNLFFFCFFFGETEEERVRLKLEETLAKKSQKSALLY
jgi:hypothetical protein